MVLWWFAGLVLVCVCVGLLALSRMRMPASRLAHALVALTLAVGLWAGGDALASGATDWPHKTLGLWLLYTGAIPLPALWWALALRWSAEVGHPVPGGPGLVRVPLVFAGLMWLAMATNSWHGLFLTPVLGGRNAYEPLWWVMAVGNYALIVAAGAAVLRAVRRSEHARVRRQGLFLLAASGVVLATNVAYVVGDRVPNGTVPAFALASVIMLLAVLREGLFGALPAALPVIFENAPDGLLVLDSDGRVVHANPAARSLLAPVALPVDSHVAAQLAPWLAPAAALPSGATWDWWRAARRKDGVLVRAGSGPVERWLRVSAHPVRGRRGRLRAWTVRIYDATGEEEAAAELRRAARLEGVAELARGVAHDFNNVLAVVLGQLHLLAEDVREPEVAHRLAKVLRFVHRAGELAQQLHQYAGSDDPVREAVDLNELLADAVELVDPEGGPQVALALEPEARPVLVLAEPTPLRRALHNLLVNAREAVAVSGGGEIRAATGFAWVDPERTRGLILGRRHAAGRYAFVQVADSGPGIPRDTQERILEPFFSTKGKHRGMGLSTVVGVVRAHGALLQLDSAPGRGTRFVLYLEPAPERRETEPAGAADEGAFI